MCSAQWWYTISAQYLVTRWWQYLKAIEQFCPVFLVVKEDMKTFLYIYIYMHVYGPQVSLKYLMAPSPASSHLLPGAAWGWSTGPLCYLSQELLEWGHGKLQVGRAVCFSHCSIPPAQGRHSYISVEWKLLAQGLQRTRMGPTLSSGQSWVLTAALLCCLWTHGPAPAFLATEESKA